MLTRAKTLTGHAFHGLDGDLGKVKNFYFDDHSQNSERERHRRT
jgi:hypothetical protein